MRILQAFLILTLVLVASHADALTLRSGGSRVPAAARAAGYTLNTFSTEANFKTANVDKGLTNTSGFQWYFFNFFGLGQASSFATLNSNGTITLNELEPNGMIVSAAQITGGAGFVGTAFGGGGYFEAELSFNPNADFSEGWPAWWMMSLEHLASLNGQIWPGQASDYAHFLEVDTFEFDRFGALNEYGATLHDWYGEYNITCPGGYCVVNSDFNAATAKVPTGTDWTIPHRIAALWIPATNSTPGSYTFYFDDQQVSGPFAYSQFTTQSAPPTSSTPWTFGVGDQQHLVLLIGAGATPLTVKSVNVWQASAAGNVHN